MTGTKQANATHAAVSRRRPRIASRFGISLAALLFPLLLALPATASAASFWCTWMPWFPGCGAPVPTPTPTPPPTPTPTPTPGTPAALTEVSSFGSNPGNLKMFVYRPANLAVSRPLVVALHGCTQQASSYGEAPGWIKFAEKYRFALLLPQQQQGNNSSKCFNWFQSTDIERDNGEALSIKQMIDRIKTDASSDPARVYVTGLSAGAAMTAVMMATYPEVFAGGAIIAGIPYKCATTVNEALTQCGVSTSGQLSSMKDLTPAQWGNLVRSASSQGGAYPPVSLWQGTSDTTVNPQDQRELMEQWTNALGIGQTPSSEDTINGNAHKVYTDSAGKAILETVLIQGMAHGTPIAPGTGDQQCGTAAPYILDVGVCSSYYISKFWGLDAQ
jgi:poly(hydroxyalkanoate) depolymerase family esterase